MSRTDRKQGECSRTHTHTHPSNKIHNDALVGLKMIKVNDKLRNRNVTVEIRGNAKNLHNGHNR